MVTLFQLHNISSADTEIGSNNSSNTLSTTNIANRILKFWSSSKEEYDVTRNLRVNIGANEHGNMHLDLYEKADGPHMNEFYAVRQTSAAGGETDRQTRGKGRRKDCRRHGKAGGAGRGFCETASRGGAYRAGLRGTRPLPPVLRILPCLSGERRRRRGGGHHLPRRRWGYAGGRGHLLLTGGGAPELSGYLRKHPRL